MNDFIEFRIQREPDAQVWGVSEKLHEGSRLWVRSGIPRATKELVRMEVLKRLDEFFSRH